MQLPFNAQNLERDRREQTILLKERDSLPSDQHKPAVGEPVELDLKRDLCRLARFGANVSDAHSCFIFLPSSLFADNTPGLSATGADERVDQAGVVLAGMHSLSTDIKSQCRVRLGSGLIGWVAKHQQPIHVSPFEHDSRTLGMYTTDQQLKSLIGIPVILNETAAGVKNVAGVIACDSKKSYAFSKLQGKLLENLAAEIANTVKLNIACQQQAEHELSWHDFLYRGNALIDALGKGAIEVLRIRVTSMDTLEQELGVGDYIQFMKQIRRLIQQALPPHYPAYILPNGDLVAVVDNMMSAFYENKVRALSDHVTKGRIPIAFEFTRSSFRSTQNRNNPGKSVELSDLVRASNANRPERRPEAPAPTAREGRYGFRRA